ncbi:MAG: hypothetical protein RL223_1729 [Pseudomonadota bacterium]|jgi:hypothetical protein
MKSAPSASVRAPAATPASPAAAAAGTGGALAAAPLLDRELQRLLAQQGIEACQLALVELDTLGCSLRWQLDARGRTRHGRGEGGLSAAGLNAVTAIGRTTDDSPQLQRLSPRRWSLAWRVDALQAVHAELQFSQNRARLDPQDAWPLQLMCAAALRHAASRVAPEADGPSGAGAARWRRRAAIALVLSASVAGLALSAALVPGDDGALALARPTLRTMAMILSACCGAAALALLWSARPEAEVLDEEAGAIATTASAPPAAEGHPRTGTRPRP